MRLSARFVDAPAGTGAGRAPLVLLHGFTQSGESWAPVVDALAGRAAPWYYRTPPAMAGRRTSRPTCGPRPTYWPAL